MRTALSDHTLTDDTSKELRQAEADQLHGVLHDCSL